LLKNRGRRPLEEDEIGKTLRKILSISRVAQSAISNAAPIGRAARDSSVMLSAAQSQATELPARRRPLPMEAPRCGFGKGGPALVVPDTGPVQDQDQEQEQPLSEPQHIWDDSAEAALLARLGNRADQEAWREFEGRYRDLLIGFCQHRGLQRADAEDLVQSIFARLVDFLPRFVYDRQRGRFHDYLYRCVRNAIVVWARCPDRTHFALLPFDEEVETGDHAAPDDAAIWEQEWVAHHVRRALERLRSACEPRSFVIFERFLSGASVAELVLELGMNEEAVRKVRLRMRQRLQKLIREQLLEEESPNGGGPGS
jgi:RNA polymerase sigma factor (sigma-70 family)